MSKITSPKEQAKIIFTNNSKHTKHSNPRRFHSDDLSAITESDNESIVSVGDTSRIEDDKVSSKVQKSLKELKSVFEYITLGDYLRLTFTDSKRFPYHSHCFSTDEIEVAIDKMIKKGTHRVYVELEENNAVFSGFITYELIFDYFFYTYYANMELIKKISIKNFHFCNKSVIKVSKDDSLISCLLLFERNRISMLPVMNGENIFGYLFLKDFIYLWNFEDKIELLNPISKLFELIYGDNKNPYDPYGLDRVMYASLNDNMKTVIEKMNVSHEKKLIVMENNVIAGVVCLSDLFYSVYCPADRFI